MNFLVRVGNVEAWRRFDAMEARLTAATSDRMLQLGDVREGQRVLDVASGRNEPAIRRRDGWVRADRCSPSTSMRRYWRWPRRARRRRAASPADAVAAGAFDVALRSAGRLMLAVCAERERVQYLSLPRRVLSRFCDLPAVERRARVMGTL